MKPARRHELPKSTHEPAATMKENFLNFGYWIARLAQWSGRKSVALKTGLIFLLVQIPGVPVLFGGSVAPPYEIGTWYGFKQAAISFTFDDVPTNPNQFSEALPMFNAKGLKMTLYPVINWMSPGAWPEVQNAALQGHEIGSHTVDHASLGGLTDAQQGAELTNSQNTINAEVSNQKCVTIAYPNCVVGNETLISQYYIGGRTCSGQVIPSTPLDFMQLSSVICGNVGSVQTFQDFTNTARNAYNASGWMVYLIHAIDNDPGYSPLSSSVLQSSVNFFSGNLDKYWVQTFGNVIRYIKERNAASVAETSSNDTSITVQVTDGLDDSIFNYPLTLRRPMPESWPGVIVTQNGSPVPAVVFPIGSTNYVRFDAVPDGGDVVLTEDSSPAPPLISVAPTNQDFGNIPIGTAVDHTFTVQNIGGSTLIGTASVSAPFSIAYGNQYTLASNETATITVRFTPTVANTVTQNLSFTGGGGSSVQVTGSGFGFVSTQISGGHMSNGLFNFTLTGMEGSNYVILGSSNLSSWWPVTTNTLPAGGTTIVTDPSMTNQPRRFYRGMLQQP